jgi:zinc D-Ala-D-Ala dipeptidase
VIGSLKYKNIMKYYVSLALIMIILIVIAPFSWRQQATHSMPVKSSPPSTFTTTPQQSSTSKNSYGLVNLSKFAPEIRQDMRYATPNNFMKRKLYPVSQCLLQSKVAEQLKQVQFELEKDKKGLKVFDCYRPIAIQKQMWKILPDSNYVANPAKGSRHNRASAVDLTLVDLVTGKDQEMPSEFDDFSKRAHIDYPDVSLKAKSNRKILRTAMEKHGFSGIKTEWWHYDSIGWERYPLLDAPFD